MPWYAREIGTTTVIETGRMRETHRPVLASSVGVPSRVCMGGDVAVASDFPDLK
jgi:hypothetical protein